MNGILLRINEKYKDLSPTDKKVATYILENPDSVVGMSITDLADMVGTSKAGVMRFCKSIDCYGYRDFSLKYVSELAVSKNSRGIEYTDIQVGDKTESIIKNVCINSKKAIDDSCSVLDYQEVEKAVKCFISAKHINFFGVGASAVVTMDAQQKLLRINKYSTAYLDPHMQMTVAANSSAGDVAVGISWSGETKDTIEASKLSKENDATLITITKYGKNRLSDLADIKLMLVAPETSIRAGAISSRIAQMNMIDILYSCLLSQDYYKVKKYLEKTRKKVKSKRYQS